MGWMKTQSWCVRLPSTQSKDNDTNWQQKETTKTKVSTCCCVSLDTKCHQFLFLSLWIFTQFWPVRDSLKRVTLRIRVIWGDVFAHAVGYNRRPSAVNDSPATYQNEFVKIIRLRFSPELCEQRVAPFDRKPLLASFLWRNQVEGELDDCAIVGTSNKAWAWVVVLQLLVVNGLM